MRFQIDWSDRRKIFYIKKIAGIPTVFRKKTISPTTVQAGYKSNLFPFDINKPAFRIKNIFYYVLDVDKGQLQFGEGKAVSPVLLDAVMKRQIVKQIISGLEAAPLFSTILMMVLAAGLGLACGFILGKFV